MLRWFLVNMKGGLWVDKDFAVASHVVERETAGLDLIMGQQFLSQMFHFLTEEVGFEILFLPLHFGHEGLVFLHLEGDYVYFILIALGFPPGTDGAVVECLRQLLLEIPFQHDAGVGGIVGTDDGAQSDEIFDFNHGTVALEVVEPETQEVAVNLVADGLRAFFGQEGALADDDVVVFDKPLDLAAYALFS